MFSQLSLSLSLTSPSTTSFTTQRPWTASSVCLHHQMTESVVSLSDTESAFSQLSQLSQILPHHSPSSTPCIGSTFQDNAHSETSKLSAALQSPHPQMVHRHYPMCRSQITHPVYPIDPARLKGLRLCLRVLRPCLQLKLTPSMLCQTFHFSCRVLHTTLFCHLVLHSPQPIQHQGSGPFW
jgi:hypothetical protein